MISKRFNLKEKIQLALFTVVACASLYYYSFEYYRKSQLVFTKDSVTMAIVLSLLWMFLAIRRSKIEAKIEWSKHFFKNYFLFIQKTEINHKINFTVNGYIFIFVFLT